MRLLCVLVTLLAAPVFAQKPAVSAQKTTVLLISIDGLRPDAITHADEHHLKVPNLRRFLAEGTYATGVRGVVPTLTYPSHTTLVTGVVPAVHGITSNTTFDPLFENQVGWFWYAEQQHARTLWQAAHDAGMVTANLNWPVTVDAPGIDYNLPEYWRASTPDDLMLMRALARPLGLEQQLEADLGPYVDGNTLTIASDQTRTRFALAMLRRYHPGFFAVHLSALDEEEHLSSPFSAKSNEVLEAIDSMIGQLREAAVQVNPAAVVAIVSDHGFAQTDFHTNLYAPLIKAGLLTPAAAGNPLATRGFSSWKATLWPAGGSAAIMLHDPADGATRDQVMKLFSDLAADPANGIERIVPAAELHELGGFPQAIGLIVLHPPFQLGYAFSGPLVTPAPSTGMHGYLPSNPDMLSTFMIAGRGIAHGRSLNLIDMVEIAPTLASILGVPFPVTKPLQVR